MVNGIDYKEWNPAIDPHLATDGYQQYDMKTLHEGKAACKAALQKVGVSGERAGRCGVGWPVGFSSGVAVLPEGSLLVWRVCSSYPTSIQVHPLRELGLPVDHNSPMPGLKVSPLNPPNPSTPNPHPHPHPHMRTPLLLHHCRSWACL